MQVYGACGLKTQISIVLEFLPIVPAVSIAHNINSVVIF